MSELDGNSKDKFSHIAAHLISAICNYLPSESHAQILPLNVGETVHILEQYGEGWEGKP